MKSDSRVMPNTALLIFLETVLKVMSSVCLVEKGSKGGRKGEKEGGKEGGTEEGVARDG